METDERLATKVSVKEEARGRKRGSEDVEERKAGEIQIDDVETYDEDVEMDGCEDTVERVGQKMRNRWDPKLARAARAEELAYTKKIVLYDEVQLAECWGEDGQVADVNEVGRRRRGARSATSRTMTRISRSSKGF